MRLGRILIRKRAKLESIRTRGMQKRGPLFCKVTGGAITQIGSIIRERSLEVSSLAIVIKCTARLSRLYIYWYIFIQTGGCFGYVSVACMYLVLVLYDGSQLVYCWVSCFAVVGSWLQYSIKFSDPQTTDDIESIETSNDHHCPQL